MSAAHESANFDYRFPAAEQSDWCTFRVSNGAMGTVAFTPSLKVRRHWDSAQTLAANPTKPASTREVLHLVFRVFDILSPKVVFSGGEWSTDSW